MADSSLHVLIEGQLAGLLQRRSGQLSFRYDDCYLRGGSATPLSVSLPLQGRAHTNAAVAPQDRTSWLGVNDEGRFSLAGARRLGLSAAMTTVQRFDDQTAIVVERFDRTSGAGPWLRRIHQEDVCQALSVDPLRKYQNEGGPGPVDMTRLINRVMPPSVAGAALRQLADALCLNWLLAGTDAHAKNYGLLLAGAQVRLTPLYDVASALPYPDRQIQKLRLAMQTGGSYHLTPRTASFWELLDAVATRVAACRQPLSVRGS